MGKGTKLYRSVCKTGNWTVKNTTQNAPKVIHHTETQNQKIFWEGGTAPYTDPSPSGDSLRRLNPRARPRRLWRLIFHSTGALLNWPLKANSIEKNQIAKTIRAV